MVYSWKIGKIRIDDEGKLMKLTLIEIEKLYQCMCRGYGIQIEEKITINVWEVPPIYALKRIMVR